MPASPRTPKPKWVEAALGALAAGGPDSIRVDVLAKDLGVTRGGFYWHFDNREALLEAALDQWERDSVDAVIAQVDAAARAGDGGDPRRRLRRLLALAAQRDELRGLDLAVRDWARRDRAVARRLRSVDERRMAYLRELFGDFVTDPDDVEARCLLLMSLWVADGFLPAGHQGRSRQDVLRVALDHLLA